MKKLLFIFLLLVTQLSLAQTLSGSIKYSVKYNMNPKEKEQMEKYGMALPSSMEIASDGTSKNDHVINCWCDDGSAAHQK
jgi:hypothetical protein